jgi:urease accessory protein
MRAGISVTHGAALLLVLKIHIILLRQQGGGYRLNVSSSSESNYSWLRYAQFLDSALPVGGFSHSFGLETMVQSGKLINLRDLNEYIVTMLFHAWAPMELMAVKAVYLHGPSDNWNSIWLADQLQHVQRAARETREGSQKMGRRLLRLARNIYPNMLWEPLDAAVQAGQCYATYPIVHGWIGWQLGVPLQQAAEGYLYCNMTHCINSALRLMSMGQTEGQALLAELLPRTSEAWLSVAEKDPTDCFSNTPAADINMMRHETLYSRLFMS